MKKRVMNNLFRDKVDTAIDLLRRYEPVNGYKLAFSGGKDSMVVDDIAMLAGVKYERHYNMTTLDPPELVRFIMKHYPGTKFIRPLRSLREVVIEKQYPPTRIARYCCEVLKEHYRPEGTLLMGLRWAESIKRSKRQQFEVLHKSGTFAVNPIIDWSTDEVWTYIKERGLSYCELYDEGFKRLGCCMCPMSGSEGMKRDAMRWPQIAYRWRKILNEMYNYQTAVRGKDYKNWESGDCIYQWWIEQPKSEKKCKEQMECI